MVVVGKRAVLDLFNVLRNSRDRDFRELGEAFGEFRLEVGEHAEQIVAEKDLSVSADAGADADGWDGELLGNQLGYFGRHRLELEHEAAGILDRQRILEDFHGRIRRAPLNLEAAEHRNGVRRQADMRRGRNAGIDQRFQEYGPAICRPAA